MRQHQLEWIEYKRKQFASLKKWLKILPTKAKLRNSFIFKKFGRSFFEKHTELFSFSYDSMKLAYYAGWILTFLPVMGIQITLAILLAIFLRCNVMMLVALQMISNPFTVGFLWGLEYKIGKFIFSILPFDKFFTPKVAAHLEPVTKGALFLNATLAICFGGLILGIICGKLSCVLHKYILNHRITNYEQFVAERTKAKKE